MNANRRDGPNHVAQHGVYIIDIPWRQGDVRGGKTTLSDDTHSGRPVTAVSIGVLRRDDPHSVFTDDTNKVANLTKSAAASVYDVAVAHELAHAVGAEHHGEGGDHAQTYYFQGAGDPSNPTGRARFVESSPPTDFEYGQTQRWGRPIVWSDFGRGSTIQLIWEDTKKDVAESLETEIRACPGAGARRSEVGSKLRGSAARQQVCPLRQGRQFLGGAGFARGGVRRSDEGGLEEGRHFGARTV